jgi:phosphoribosyl 1,2-cyclic phosphodiesterase
VSIRFCSLASSSAGNCYYIESGGGTRILVDAGIPLRRLERTLRSLGVEPETLQGIFITHAHRDHIASYLIKRPFATRYGIDSYASTPTWREMFRAGCGQLDHSRCHRLYAGQGVVIGDLCITGYPKLHDAAGALCFTIASETERLAIVTDLGQMTADLLQALRGCQYYIFEANHDVEMEQSSARLWSLKQRVLGQYGHLSNEQAADALVHLSHGAKSICLAHLSEECNLPELASGVVERRLRAAGLEVAVCSLPARSPSRFYGSCEEPRLEVLSLWGDTAEKA